MSQPIIVVDLGYGDAGKGSIVDWLCSPHAGEPVHTVVRFNGGAQAAHNVVTPGGGRRGRWTERSDRGTRERSEGCVYPGTPRTPGRAKAPGSGGSGGSTPRASTFHTFAQFGSGTLNPGTRTHLSRFMMVDLLALVAEAGHLADMGVADPFGLLSVDRDALLTTPYHQAANRAREAARGASRHGSCGMGVGETASYALLYPNEAPRAADSHSPRVLERKLAALRDRLADDAGFDVAAVPPPAVVAAAYRDIADRVTITGEGYLAALLRRPGRVVFEGAQGVLLDEWRGFHPYTTWSTTTFANAETLLDEAGMPGAAIRLGVTRAYMTRHGPGPFVTQDPTLELPEPHNQAGRWQGPVRVGHLDAVALRYAVECCGGVDAVALTHLDTARAHEGELRVARAYKIGGSAPEAEHGPVGSRAGKQGLTDWIAPGPFGDLEFQARLTDMLLSARPVYGAAVAWKDWPDVVAEVAGAPVAIRSHGPAASAKEGSFAALPAAASR